MAARKVTPKVVMPNDGDKVAVTITGFWDKADGYLTVPGNTDLEELYLPLESKDVTFEIVEAAPVFKEKDVAMDAEGEVFQFVTGRWKGLGSTYYDSPVYPMRRMVVEAV